MKFFLDTANLDEIRKGASFGILDGVTTNPSLAAKEGRPFRELILEKRPSSEIRKAAHDEGMRFLRESALEKVKAGITTLKEINKVTFIETTR